METVKPQSNYLHYKSKKVVCVCVCLSRKLLRMRGSLSKACLEEIQPFTICDFVLGEIWLSVYFIIVFILVYCMFQQFLLLSGNPALVKILKAKLNYHTKFKKSVFSKELKS